MPLKVSKLLKSYLILVSLSACMVNPNQLQANLDQAIKEASTQEMNVYNSMTRDFFTYYLPLSVGRRNSTETSSILVSHNVEILMNLDVVNVLNQAYYQSETLNVLRSSVTVNEALYQKEGTFTNLKGFDVNYQVSVNPLSEDEVLLTLETDAFIFSSIHNSVLSPEILYDMIRIARSTQIQEDLILASFSNREIIDYQKETLNMFAQLAPESGTVVDMIEGEDDNLFDDSYYDAGPVVEDVPIE